jgi:hypothetical protein
MVGSRVVTVSEVEIVFSIFRAAGSEVVRRLDIVDVYCFKCCQFSHLIPNILTDSLISL